MFAGMRALRRVPAASMQRRRRQRIAYRSDTLAVIRVHSCECPWYANPPVPAGPTEEASSPLKVAASSEAMRNGGFSDSVPCAVDVPTIDVWLLDPHAQSSAAPRATLNGVSNLNTMSPCIRLSEIYTISRASGSSLFLW